MADGDKSRRERGNQFMTFFVKDLYFGIELLKVQEVMSYQIVTAVPRAPRVVEGLINLRGRIVMTVDLRRRLGLPARGEKDKRMMIVVLTNDGPVSIIVDDIRGVVEASADQFEVPPDTLGSDARALISGVCKMEKHLLHVLDVERVAALSGADR